jgi:hypothetical protein
LLPLVDEPLASDLFLPLVMPLYINASATRSPRTSINCMLCECAKRKGEGRTCLYIATTNQLHARNIERIQLFRATLLAMFTPTQERRTPFSQHAGESMRRGMRANCHATSYSAILTVGLLVALSGIIKVYLTVIATALKDQPTSDLLSDPLSDITALPTTNATSCGFTANRTYYAITGAWVPPSPAEMAELRRRLSLVQRPKHPVTNCYFFATEPQKNLDTCERVCHHKGLSRNPSLLEFTSPLQRRPTPEKT